jgi:hypothetical protein
MSNVFAIFRHGVVSVGDLRTMSARRPDASDGTERFLVAVFRQLARG